MAWPRLAFALAATAAAADDAPLVAICALARDEGAFLAEWLDFYRYNGVARAFLYVDDLSRDATWDVVAPFMADGFATVVPWPPRPASGLAREILARGWTNVLEPLERTRHFAGAGGCGIRGGKPSHCAGHYQASSHCVGRARDEGLAWVGLIDPDEFWFSPRFGSLPAVLAAEAARGTVGVGQNAFIYGPDAVAGPCASLPPVTTTHLLRGNASKVERWSKFPWVRLDAVVLNRVRVHEHDFVGYACDKRECGGEKYNQFRVHEFPNASCCDAVSRVPPARDLRLNHYQYKSPECSREKAARNGHADSALTSEKASLLSEVYDDAILPHVPPRYKAPCRARGVHCDGPPAAAFADVRDGVAAAPKAAEAPPPAEPVVDPFRDTINIFVAVDKGKYLAELVASMREAYALSLDARGGRRYRWFVLYAGDLNSTAICEAVRLAHYSSAPARAEWRGCASYGHARFSDACAVRPERAAKAKTLNTIHLQRPPTVLREIYELTAQAFQRPDQCHSRPNLVNYMNLAPDAVHAFLLPLGVRRVAIMDTDATPHRRFPDFYDSDAVPAAIVTALSRPQDKCGIWEHFNKHDPVVRATLGATDDEVNQKRFRADTYKVKDLERYCEAGIAEGIVAMLRRQLPIPGRRFSTRQRLWNCGLQQPPLILAASNHTELLRHSDLKLVGTPGVTACDPENAGEKHVTINRCEGKNLEMSNREPEFLSYYLSVLEKLDPASTRPGSDRPLKTPGCETARWDEV